MSVTLEAILKYPKAPTLIAEAQKALADEACQQLESYLQTKDLRNVPSLAAFAIVFVGKQTRFVKQVN